MANEANVADWEQVQGMAAQALDEWGRIDILVNNAGILRDKSFLKMDVADFGLVNFVHPDDKLDEECDKLAARLANGPTFVYGQAKKLMYRSLENEFESQLQMEAECFAACAARDDYREGVAAFVEKRKAKFTGN